jgi:hypothetical protein
VLGLGLGLEVVALHQLHRDEAAHLVRDRVHLVRDRVHLVRDRARAGATVRARVRARIRARVRVRAGAWRTSGVLPSSMKP